MIEPIILLFSGGVSIDQATNRLSIFNVIEEIPVQALPALVPDLWVIAVFRRLMNDPQSATAIATLSLGQQRLLEQEVRIEFGGEALGNRLVFQMGAVPLNTVSDLSITIRVLECNRTYSVPVRLLGEQEHGVGSQSSEPPGLIETGAASAPHDS